MNSKSSAPATPTDSKTPDYFGLNIPFMAYVGLVPEHLDTKVARTRLPYRPELLNSRGDVHGGTLMAVLDFTLSAAARGQEAGVGMATIDMSTHFLAPARGELVIEARCLRMGATIAFCEGQILDEKGKLLATASASFKVVRNKKAPVGSD